MASVTAGNLIRHPSSAARAARPSPAGGRGSRPGAERALVRAAQAGSREALEALVPRATGGPPHRAAWLVTGDAAAAEDIAQEALLAAIRALDSFDRAAALRALAASHRREPGDRLRARARAAPGGGGRGRGRARRRRSRRRRGRTRTSSRRRSPGSAPSSARWSCCGTCSTTRRARSPGCWSCRAAPSTRACAARSTPWRTGESAVSPELRERLRELEPPEAGAAERRAWELVAAALRRAAAAAGSPPWPAAGSSPRPCCGRGRRDRVHARGSGRRRLDARRRAPGPRRQRPLRRSARLPADGAPARLVSGRGVGRAARTARRPAARRLPRGELVAARPVRRRHARPPARRARAGRRGALDAVPRQPPCDPARLVARRRLPDRLPQRRRRCGSSPATAPATGSWTKRRAGVPPGLATARPATTSWPTRAPTAAWRSPTPTRAAGSGARYRGSGRPALEWTPKGRRLVALAPGGCGCSIADLRNRGHTPMPTGPHAQAMAVHPAAAASP